MEENTKKSTKSAKETKGVKEKKAEEDKKAMEEKKEKFMAKLQELLALAKQKKNSLEYQEISEFFKDMELNAEEFEKAVAELKAVIQ